jgi:hypothetical protein
MIDRQACDQQSCGTGIDAANTKPGKTASCSIETVFTAVCKNNDSAMSHHCLIARSGLCRLWPNRDSAKSTRWFDSILGVVAKEIEGRRYRVHSSIMGLDLGLACGLIVESESNGT